MFYIIIIYKINIISVIAHLCTCTNFTIKLLCSLRGRQKYFFISALIHNQISPSSMFNIKLKFRPRKVFACLSSYEIWKMYVRTDRQRRFCPGRTSHHEVAVDNELPWWYLSEVLPIGKLTSRCYRIYKLGCTHSYLKKFLIKPFWESAYFMQNLHFKSCFKIISFYLGI